MSKNKNIKRSLYILTEGHTEQAYFSRIGEILGDEDEWKYSVTVDVREIGDRSKTDPVNMVKEAKKSQRSYDEIWVVFDKDRDRDQQNLQAIELAYKSKIKIAFSSISFEEWVLLHFEKSTTAFQRSDCESRGQECTCFGAICVSTYIKINHYPTYVKGKAKLYDELSDKRDRALEYAAWSKFHHSPKATYHLLNPFTDVDNLVAQLFELPKIRYSGINNPFYFEGIDFCVTSHSTTNNIVTVSIQTNNNSDRTFIFNNVQQNIKLLDTKNTELTYTIPQATTINTGENRTTDIQFAINEQFQATKLKFHTANECVYVEL
jgi:RloB-like protein